MDSKAQSQKLNFEVEWGEQVKIGLPQSEDALKRLARTFWNLGFAGGLDRANEILREQTERMVGARLRPEIIFHASTCQCDRCTKLRPVSSPAGEPSNSTQRGS